MFGHNDGDTIRSKDGTARATYCPTLFGVPHPESAWTIFVHGTAVAAAPTAAAAKKILKEKYGKEV